MRASLSSLLLCLVLPASSGLQAQSPAERAGALLAAQGAEREKLLAGPLDFDTYRAVTLDGLARLQAAQLAPALASFELAHEIAVRLGNGRAQAEALWMAGTAHDQLGNRDEAERALAESLRLAEAEDDAELLVKSLGALAVCDYRRGRYSQAEERLRRGVELARRTGQEPAASRLMSTLGEIFRVQGRYAEAREACGQGLQLARAGQQAAHEAIASNCLAIVHTALGEYSAALGRFDAALRLAEQLGLYESRVAALNNLGMVHQLQGDREQALAYYRDFLGIVEASGDRAGLTRGLLNVGGLLRDLGRLGEARPALERAAALAEQLGDPELRSHAIQSLGDLDFSDGQLAAARERYSAALALPRAGLTSTLDAALLQRLSDVELLGKQPAAALELAERATALATANGGREALWRARTSAGRALLLLNRRVEARRALEQAVELIEELRATLASPEDQAQAFLENKLDPYRLLSELCLGEGLAEEALTWAERAKARRLLDLVRFGHLDLDARLTPAERDQQQRLRQALAQAGRAARSAPGTPGAQQRLEQARHELASFRARLFELHPLPALQAAEGPSLRLTDAERLLADDRTALLEYQVTDGQVTLFVITREAGAPRLAALRLDTNGVELRRRTRAWREALERRDLDVLAEARALYDLLLRPVEGLLRGRTRLTLVPDGALWELPFQALAPRPGRFLVEDRAVALAPSLLALLQVRTRRTAAAASDPAALLALGNPTLGAPGTRRAGLRRMDAALEPLPEAERQVQQLGRLYGPKSALFVGPQATEEAVKREASRHRILHFATHGLLNDVSPMHSQLVLAAAPPESDEDGLLEAREVLELDVNAELAVLSACETGRGRVAGGEGLIGFPWAFLVAGCPTTLVSQWSVDAASTSELMLAFHRHLRAGAAPARAQQAAARELLRRPAWRHPFYWAAFVVVGDGGLQ